MTEEACKDCYAHGRIEQQLKDSRDDSLRVEKKVDGLYKFLIGNLAAAVLTLITIITTLAVLYIQKEPTGGVHYGTNTKTQYRVESERPNRTSSHAGKIGPSFAR